MMVVFWALIIAGIIVVVRTLSRRGALGQSNAGEALAILGRRYAGGEISKEQFEEMKRTLGQGRAA